MIILRAEDIRKAFGGVQALDGVTLDVPARGVIGLIGPNGSGKSTLINVLTGVFPVDSGRMYIEGRDYTNESAHKIASQGIMRTFQVPRVFSNMSVIENMLVSRRGQSGESLLNTFLKWRKVREEEEENIKRALGILEFLEIDHMKNELASNLSGGQQKLLALGRALMGEPKVLLLDEPVAGVNPKLSRKIFEKILELRKEGMTFLIIEHNVDIMLEFCDEIYVMNRGKIVFNGEPQEVLESREVIEVYLGE
jgi:ABC-type branched-subunit amino acid transport system ATPase component